MLGGGYVLVVVAAIFCCGPFESTDSIVPVGTALYNLTKTAKYHQVPGTTRYYHTARVAQQQQQHQAKHLSIFIVFERSRFPNTRRTYI